MELLQPLPKLPGSLLVCCDVGEAIEDVLKPSFIDYQIFKNSNLCFLNFWTHVFTNDQIFSQVYGWLSNPASAYISLSTRVEVTIFLLVPPVCANHLQEVQFLFLQIWLCGDTFAFAAWSLLVWKHWFLFLHVRNLWHLQNAAFHGFVGFGLSSKSDLVGLGQIQHLAAVGFKLKRFTDL